MGLAEGSHFSIFLASCSIGLPKFFAAWGRSEAVAAAGEGARDRFQIDAFPGGFCSKDHPCKGRRYNHHTVTTTIATTTTTTSIHSGDSWDTFAFSIDMHIRQRWILKLRKERLLHPFWSDLTHKSGLAWKPADSPDLQIDLSGHGMPHIGPDLCLVSQEPNSWKVVLLAPRWRRAAVSGNDPNSEGGTGRDEDFHMSILLCWGCGSRPCRRTNGRNNLCHSYWIAVMVAPCRHAGRQPLHLGLWYFRIFTFTVHTFIIYIQCPYSTVPWGDQVPRPASLLRPCSRFQVPAACPKDWLQHSNQGMWEATGRGWSPEPSETDGALWTAECLERYWMLWESQLRRKFLWFNFKLYIV